MSRRALRRWDHRSIALLPETAFDWQADAACNGVLLSGEERDVDFFPSRSNQHGTQWQRMRDRYCAQCPVLAECLEFGVDHRYFGLWGGKMLDTTFYKNKKREDAA